MGDQWTELEEAAKKATPGPWLLEKYRTNDQGHTDCGVHTPNYIGLPGALAICRAPRLVKESEWQRDGGFIAACDPTTILSLISAARGKQRTPGTHESCDLCACNVIDGGARMVRRRGSGRIGICTDVACPLRQEPKV